MEKRHFPAGIGNRGDRADQSAAVQEQDIQLGVAQILNHAEKAMCLGQMRDELGQIICLDCEERIPEARLKALPKAVRCKGCEERRENRLNGKRIGF